MASFITNDVQSTNQKVIILTGTFTTDGSGLIASSGARNKRVTVTRTGTGAYRVTLAEKVPAVISAMATIEKSAAVDFGIQIASTTTQQLNIITRDNSTGAAADLVSATVHFLIFVDDLKDG